MYHVEQSSCFIRPGTPQDQALGLSVNMFTALLMVCSSLAKVVREEGLQEGENGNLDNQSTVALLRQYLPAVKVWIDWMVQHAALWQASNVWYVWATSLAYATLVFYPYVSFLHDLRSR